MIAMRRHAEGLLEGSRKVIEAQIDELCERGQRDLLREMLIDEFYYAFLLPNWQTTTKAPHRSRCRSFQSSEFVHQHEAQSLHIRPARWIGVSDFGLELEGCVPKRLIKEKQARADCGAG